MNNFNIKHAPILDIEKAAAHYSAKDGVDVKYICTTSLNDGTLAADVFYRESPHPDFGNRYFGLYLNPHANDTRIMITNADGVEGLEFAMIEDIDGGLVYSQHRHDFKVVGGNIQDPSSSFIDGGRAYVRCGGNPIPRVHMFKVVDGEFVVTESEYE